MPSLGLSNGCLPGVELFFLEGGGIGSFLGAALTGFPVMGATVGVDETGVELEDAAAAAAEEAGVSAVVTAAKAAVERSISEGSPTYRRTFNVISRSSLCCTMARNKTINPLFETTRHACLVCILSQL